MATRITINGQVTLPQWVRDALRLSAGDGVEFQLKGNGELLLRKATPSAPARRRSRPVQPRVAAQTRRRAAELSALLRGLD